MSLNADQEQVVKSESSRILCIAGAGTGKTHSMISRINYLVSTGVDPSTILVLTFTRAAAFEMKSRYKCTSSNSPTFCTFHSFCYKLILRDQSVLHEIGYNSLPSIATNDEEKRILNECRLQSSINLKSYQDINMVKFDNNANDQRIFNKFYKKLLRKNNLITFDYLCKSICKLFSNGSNSINKYKIQYKYIFVDEFQDTDLTQFKFVTSFLNSNLFLIGDPLQAIYGFRGADSAIIKKLSMDDSWDVYKLSSNYRCSKQICEYANKIFEDSNTSYKVDLKSDRNSKDVIETISNKSTSFECVNLDVLHYIKQVLSENCSSSTAILCRTNKECQYIYDYLKSDVNCNYNNEQHDKVYRVLKSCIDPEYLENYILSHLNEECYSRCILLKALKEHVNFKSMNISNSLKNFIDLTEYIKQVLDSDTNINSKLDMIDYILNINVNRNIEFDSVYMYIELFLDSYSKSDEDSDVYIGTIHSSKGLEYETVIIVNVDGGSFPLSNEENLNLFYVGCTRAKDNLYVFRCKTNDGGRH